VIGLGLYIINLEASNRKRQETARLLDIERYNYIRRRVLFLLFYRLCLAGIISIYRRVGFVINLYMHVLTPLFLFLFPRLKLTG
jgi:hypothetical protein